jgi:rod shape-determining protein MreB
MIFDWLLGFLSKDLAIDLGTANTLVYTKEGGVVVNEPSIVVIEEQTGKVQAIGKEAKKMYGKTPKGVEAIRPLKDGVIADFEITKIMISHFIGMANQKKSLLRPRPRTVIGVPSGITQVEKKAVGESAAQAGVREVSLVEESMAAAVGMDLPIAEPAGNMVVDIGGGTTDVAVISLTGIVYSKSIRVAGDEMDEGIIQYLRRKYNMLIGPNAAEQVKFKIGNAFLPETEQTMEIKGMDCVTGIPKALTVTDEEIKEATKEPVQAIINAIQDALEHLPPELANDIIDRGIFLSGGGALLTGLDKLIQKELNVKVTIPDDPLLSVVLGTGKMLDDHDLRKKVALN